MGVGTIPWSAVERYAQVHELDRDETEDLHFLLQQMDAAYINFHDEQMKAKQRK